MIDFLRLAELARAHIERPSALTFSNLTILNQAEWPIGVTLASHILAALADRNTLANETQKLLTELDEIRNELATLTYLRAELAEARGALAELRETSFPPDWAQGALAPWKQAIKRADRFLSGVTP